MTGMNTDTGMILAGVVLTLIAALEFTSVWKRVRDGRLNSRVAYWGSGN
jgi:hypothetical protein